MVSMKGDWREMEGAIVDRIMRATMAFEAEHK